MNHYDFVRLTFLVTLGKGILKTRNILVLLFHDVGEEVGEAVYLDIEYSSGGEEVSVDDFVLLHDTLVLDGDVLELLLELKGLVPELVELAVELVGVVLFFLAEVVDAALVLDT